MRYGNKTLMDMIISKVNAVAKNSYVRHIEHHDIAKDGSIIISLCSDPDTIVNIVFVNGLVDEENNALCPKDFYYAIKVTYMSGSIRCKLKDLTKEQSIALGKLVTKLIAKGVKKSNMELSNLVLGGELSLDKLIQNGKVISVDRNPKEAISAKDHHNALIFPREAYTICSNIVNDDSIIKVYRLPIYNLIYGRHPSESDRYDRSYVIEAELNSNQRVKKTIFHDKNKEDYDKLFLFLCKSSEDIEMSNDLPAK